MYLSFPLWLPCNSETNYKELIFRFGIGQRALGNSIALIFQWISCFNLYGGRTLIAELQLLEILKSHKASDGDEDLLTISLHNFKAKYLSEKKKLQRC